MMTLLWCSAVFVIAINVKIANGASIAFHVGLSQNVKDLPINSKLKFDTVYLNEGNGYDSSTGIFTCPEDGVYVYHWTILTAKGKYFFADFMVNGQNIGRSTVNASSTAIYRQKKDDKAWIEPHHTYVGQFAHEGWSFFSGYKL